MNGTNRMIITNDDGQDVEVEIVLTFEHEGVNYVLFTIPDDPEGNVYPYVYNEDGDLDAVTDPDLLEICSEVLGAFQDEDDEEEEA